MFGFLAAFGPIGIAAAVVGTVGVAVLASDSGSNSHSNEGSVRNNYNNDKKDALQEEIDLYVEEQIAFIKQKYNADISINDEMSQLSSIPELDSLYASLGSLKNLNISGDTSIEILSRDDTIERKVEKLKGSIKDLESILKLLQKDRDEFTV